MFSLFIFTICNVGFSVTVFLYNMLHNSHLVYSVKGAINLSQTYDQHNYTQCSLMSLFTLTKFLHLAMHILSFCCLTSMFLLSKWWHKSHTVKPAIGSRGCWIGYRTAHEGSGNERELRVTVAFFSHLSYTHINPRVFSLAMSGRGGRVRQYGLTSVSRRWVRVSLTSPWSTSESSVAHETFNLCVCIGGMGQEVCIRVT